jgi:hypothetical protein
VLQLRQQELLRFGIRSRQCEQRRRVTVSGLRRDGPSVEGYGLGSEPVASAGTGSQVPPLASQGTLRFPARGGGDRLRHYFYVPYFLHWLIDLVGFRERSNAPI